MKSPVSTERLDLAPITLHEIYPSAGRLVWAEKLEMTWPIRIITTLMESPGDPICEASYESRRVVLHKPVAPLVSIRKMIETVRETTSYSSKPVQSRMPFSYQSLPFQLRWWAASLLVRFHRANRRGVMAFPSWPLDLSLDGLADLAQELEGASDRAHGVDSKWVVLTHDIDTKESLKNLPRFLEIEREFGARSTNFVVPCSWRLDNELLGDVLASGNEIGIHGYDHSNRTAFLPPAEIRSRLESSRDFAERFQARGYRAPSLLRTPRLIEALAEFVDYDASVPNVDGFYSSRPGGCATSRPYHHVCGLAEIPLTLPSDANLLFQRFTPDEILSLWKKLALLILRSGGLVTVLTHCEERYSGNRGMHGIYSRFLDFIGSSCLGSWKTMGDVANSMAPDERSQSSRKK